MITGRLAASVLTAARAMSEACVADRLTQLPAVEGAISPGQPDAVTEHRTSDRVVAAAVPLLAGLPPGPLNLSAIAPWPNLGLRRASIRMHGVPRLARSATGRLCLDGALVSSAAPDSRSAAATFNALMLMREAGFPPVHRRLDEALCRGLRGFVCNDRVDPINALKGALPCRSPAGSAASTSPPFNTVRSAPSRAPI